MLENSFTDEKKTWVNTDAEKRDEEMDGTYKEVLWKM